jgi:hypothetical protein
VAVVHQMVREFQRLVLVTQAVILQLKVTQVVLAIHHSKVLQAVAVVLARLVETQAEQQTAQVVLALQVQLLDHRLITQVAVVVLVTP